MGTPITALAAAPAAGAIAKEARKVLTGDLVTFEGRIYRIVTFGKGKAKVEFLEPVDYTVHVNPVTIGLGLAAVAAGVIGLSLAAWLAGIGVKLDPKVEARLREVNALIVHGENRLQELDRLIAFSGATDPEDPLIVERDSIQAQIVDLKKERSRLRRGILRLERRDRIIGATLIDVF